MNLRDMNDLLNRGYQNITLIGRGRFSTVYYATKEQQNTRHKYALKVTSDTNWEMGRHEIEILRTLSHTSIVTYYSYFIDKHRICMVLECCRTDLSQFIHKKPFREDKIKVLLENMFSVLIYLKTENVCHLDIKPKNIMVNVNSSSLTFKLADFGTAQYCTAENMKMCMLWGTFGYFAPERIKREGCDLRSDIWSMGIVLAEVIFGKLYYFNKTMDEIRKMVYDKTLLVFPFHKFYVSEELKDLMFKLLTYDPNARIFHEQLLQHRFFKMDPMLQDVAGASHNLALYESDGNKLRQIVSDLKELSGATPQMEAGIEIAILGEQYLMEGKHQLALNYLKDGLDILLPLTKNEPDGSRKKLLLSNVNRWLELGEKLQKLINES